MSSIIEHFICLSNSVSTALIANGASQYAPTTPEYVLRDPDSTLRVRFFRRDASTQLLSQVDYANYAILGFGAKTATDYGSDAAVLLFYAGPFTRDASDTDDIFFDAPLNLNKTAFITAMGTNKTLTLRVEFEEFGGRTLAQFDAIGVHDVLNGTEGIPSDAVPPYPTTPTDGTVLAGGAAAWVKLTFAQLWAKFLLDISLTFPWSRLTDTPTTFPASAHTHPTSDVTGLDATLATLAPLASPPLTGIPTAPTAAAGTNTTQIATTAYVIAERSATATLSGKTLVAPAVTGSVSFPADTRQTFSPGATSAGLNLGSVTAAPSSLSDGDIWYQSNEASGRGLKFRGSSTTHFIVTEAATQTLTNKTLSAPVVSGTITGTYALAGTPSVSSVLSVTNATNSTSTTTGAVTVTGGVGVGGTITTAALVTGVLQLGTSVETAAGRIWYGSDQLFYRGTATHTVVDLSLSQTLTNKTLTAPVLNGTITGTYTLGGTVTLPPATDTYSGAMEIATAAEVTTGTDAVRAVTPALVAPFGKAGATVFVDAVHGVDATGVRGRRDRPFLTLGAAVAAATSGDTIQVGPGSHTVTSALSKNGVDWNFAEGATVTSSTSQIFSDGGTAMSFVVSGSAVFSSTYTDTGGILKMDHVSSEVHFACRKMVQSEGVGTSPVVRMLAGKLHFRADIVQCDNYDALWIGDSATNRACSLVAAVGRCEVTEEFLEAEGTATTAMLSVQSARGSVQISSGAVARVHAQHLDDRTEDTGRLIAVHTGGDCTLVLHGCTSVRSGSVFANYGGRLRIFGGDFSAEVSSIVYSQDAATHTELGGGFRLLCEAESPVAVTGSSGTNTMVFSGARIVSDGLADSISSANSANAVIYDLAVTSAISTNFVKMVGSTANGRYVVDSNVYL